jgi:hypothetical protein
MEYCPQYGAYDITKFMSYAFHTKENPASSRLSTSTDCAPKGSKASPAEKWKGGGGEDVDKGENPDPAKVACLQKFSFEIPPTRGKLEEFRVVTSDEIPCRADA